MLLALSTTAGANSKTTDNDNNASLTLIAMTPIANETSGQENGNAPVDTVT